MPGRWDPKRLQPSPEPPRACRRRSPRLPETPSREGLRGGERFATRAPVGAVDASDLFGRDFIFGAVAPSEDDEGGESPDQRDDDQPPDVPDHTEAPESGEECADEAGCAVSRHLDGLVGRLDLRT